tara:strand:+ start:34098 stop:34892 length:795 start_codon:yes stop_codon:yes gene_type:complete
MEYDAVEYLVEGQVATIRLNRPERLNSFNDAMHAQLRAALKDVRTNSSVRCLVVTGSGKGFCAGQDLNSRYELVNSGEDIDLGASLKRNYNALVLALKALPIPVIAAVQGTAAGAGVSLALACDIVVASRSARFIFSFAKVGLVPDAGATWALVHSLGLPRANALALLGDNIGAEEAATMGLVARCVDDGALDTEVASIVERLLANPALGQALTKRALIASTTQSLDQQLALEEKLQTVAGRSQDYAEAVRAFVEKRPPHFQGR